MISGNVEIPSIATALDREVILVLAFQICPRRVNDPTFGKPVFVVRTSRVEYEGLWAIPSVQSYLHLKKTNYISEGLVVFYSGGGGKGFKGIEFSGVGDWGGISRRQWSVEERL